MSLNPEHAAGRSSLLSLALWLCGAVYISAFWGDAAQLLPAPLDGWNRLFRPAIWDLLSDQPWAWLGVHLLVGVVVPAIVLASFHRYPWHVGAGRPNRFGWWMMAVAAIVSLPFGWWLRSLYPPTADGPTLSAIESCVLLSMIPEHFLICGVYVAILLPGRKLPPPDASTPIKGEPPFRLHRAELPAILASAALFAMVHVGKHDLELALSIPGGMALAWLTLRTRSIWPGLVAHWALNLAPQMFG